MKWVYFKKEVNGYMSAETYFPIDEGKAVFYLENEGALKEDAEIWADDVNKDGCNNGYLVAWELIDCPPRLWLEKKIESTKRMIIEAKKNVELYYSLIPHAAGISLAESNRRQKIVDDNVKILSKEVGVLGAAARLAIMSNYDGTMEDWKKWIMENIDECYFYDKKKPVV